MTTADGNAISQAFGAILREQEEERYRERYRAAMRILRTIPRGTPDEELTPKQRQAWREHDAALAWLQADWNERA